MRETRLCLRALEKDLVDSLELNLHVRESGRGVGSRGRVEGLTVDRHFLHYSRRRKEGMGTDTIWFFSDLMSENWGSSHVMVIFPWSKRQGHPLRMDGQWGSWKFEKSREILKKIIMGMTEWGNLKNMVILLGSVEGPGETGDQEFFLVPIYPNYNFSSRELGCWVQTGKRVTTVIIHCLSFARKAQWSRGF